MADENDHHTRLLHAEHLGEAFTVLVQMHAIKDKLDLTRIEIPENPWDFESAITRWVRSGECPPDVSETTAAASAALLSHEGAPAQLEILDQPEYGGDRLNIIVQPNEGGPLSVVSALGIHQAWCSPPSSGGHPLSILVHAWLTQQLPETVTPFVPVKRASLPRIHLIKAETTGLSGFPNMTGPSQPQLALPGFEAVIEGTPSWLLWMFDAGGGKLTSRGRGAPWPMRLFIGALLHLKVNDRDSQWHKIVRPTEDVIRWLHPSGWSNRRRDWDRFPQALDAMREQFAYVPISGLGSVAMMFPSIIPRAPTDPVVEFTIRVPSKAAAGARIDWPRLCQYGTDSAPLYRAYLSTAAHLDRSARRGHPITADIAVPVLNDDGNPKRRKGGGIVRSAHDTEPNKAARFVRPLTDADLARMIGFDGTDKRRRLDARKALERLDADGIDLQREGRCWRIFGPDTGK